MYSTTKWKGSSPQPHKTTLKVHPRHLKTDLARLSKDGFHCMKKGITRQLLNPPRCLITLLKSRFAISPL